MLARLHGRGDHPFTIRNELVLTISLFFCQVSGIEVIMMDCCQDEVHVNSKRLNTLNIVEINDKNIQTKKGEVKIQTNLLNNI